MLLCSSPVSFEQLCRQAEVLQSLSVLTQRVPSTPHKKPLPTWDISEQGTSAYCLTGFPRVRDVAQLRVSLGAAVRMSAGRHRHERKVPSCWCGGVGAGCGRSPSPRGPLHGDAHDGSSVPQPEMRETEAEAQGLRSLVTGRAITDVRVLVAERSGCDVRASPGRDCQEEGSRDSAWGSLPHLKTTSTPWGQHGEAEGQKCSSSRTRRETGRGRASLPRAHGDTSRRLRGPGCAQRLGSHSRRGPRCAGLWGGHGVSHCSSLVGQPR